VHVVDLDGAQSVLLGDPLGLHRAALGAGLGEGALPEGVEVVGGGGLRMVADQVFGAEVSQGHVVFLTSWIGGGTV